MKGWSTFYVILGTILLIFSVLALLFSGLFAMLSLLMTSLLFFTISSACGSIADIAARQEEIFKILSPQVSSVQTEENEKAERDEQEAKFEMFEQ